MLPCITMYIAAHKRERKRLDCKNDRRAAGDAMEMSEENVSRDATVLYVPKQTGGRGGSGLFPFRVQ